MKTEQIVKNEIKNIKTLTDEIMKIAKRNFELEGEIAKVQQGIELLQNLHKQYDGIYNALGTPTSLDDLEKISNQIKEAKEKLSNLSKERAGNDTREVECQRNIQNSTNRRDIGEFLILSFKILDLRTDVFEKGKLSLELKGLVRSSELHRGSEIVGRLDRGV